MTKEQFLNKWHFTGHNLILKDLEAVIATEIAKVWELEPVQGIPQPEQPAKPFDKERFEAMFRAVIETHESTMNALKQLDAYYAKKNN